MPRIRSRPRGSAAIRLHSILQEEFRRRRQKNPRYSLRAFAHSVQIDHSTLSQLLRGKRPITWKAVHKIAETMRWNGNAVLRAASEPGARFDSRRIAAALGITVDEVNIALTDLCSFGLIQLKGD